MPDDARAADQPYPVSGRYIDRSGGAGDPDAPDTARLTAGTAPDTRETARQFRSRGSLEGFAEYLREKYAAEIRAANPFFAERTPPDASDALDGLDAPFTLSASAPPPISAKQSPTSDAFDGCASSPRSTIRATAEQSRLSADPSPLSSPLPAGEGQPKAGVRSSQWLGTTRARRLLGLGSDNTVKAWARAGHLRSRRLPNGRTQVLLEDVLRLSQL